MSELGAEQRSFEAQCLLLISEIVLSVHWRAHTRYYNKEYRNIENQV